MDAQYRAARRFSKPSPLLRWWIDQVGSHRGGSALVFGAGLLVEADYLRRRRWRVDAVETPQSIARRSELYKRFEEHRDCRVIAELGGARRKYDLIVVTHVLEFIERPRVRQEILRELSRRMRPEAVLLLSLRGWSDVRRAKAQRPRGDGIVTGIGTWTRGYSRAEAEKLLKSSGMKVVDSPNPSSETPSQLRLVCQPK